MSDQSERNHSQQQRLVDSLLQSMQDTSVVQAQTLVSNCMSQLDSGIAETDDDQGSVDRAQPQRWLSRRVIVALATAALVLIVLSLSLFNDSSTATASVRRSLDQALQDVGRHYRVHAQMRLTGNEMVDRRSDLYVKGGSRFAWRQPLLPDHDLWLGSDNGKAWVLPPIGPVIVGRDQGLIAWVAGQDDFSSPSLHITTILRWMQDQYRLESMPPTAKEASGELANCRHVVATLKGPRTNLAPDRVELWTDNDTGVAKQLIQTWHLQVDRPGWMSITTTLIEETMLPDDFFTADGHGGQHRSKIRFNAGANL